MNELHSNPASQFRPLHVVMVFLASGIIAGGFLLLSAAESATLVDGAVEWNAESPLRAIVQILCLDYRFPTLNAGEIKGYLLGVGAGLGLLVLGVAGLARSTVADEPLDAPLEPRGKAHLPVLVAAQLLALLYVLWSFASTRWSPDPRLSLGGSVLLAIGFLWAFALSQGLSASAAQLVCRVLAVVTGLTCAVAVWYYYGRNPTLRAKFPFGNPNFLAVALIPGALLAVSNAAHQLRRLANEPARAIVWLFVSIAVVALAGWTIKLADTRGAYVGLGAGVLTILLLALPGRWKVLPAMAALAVSAATVWYFLTFFAEPSSTGRGATMRLRTYAWSYAWRMFTERPITGHGQGAFTMLGDSFSAADVLADPVVFESRIDHAHNEWLEVMADLGIVGILLVGFALALSSVALVRRLRALHGEDRANSIALLAGLVGMVIAESFGVGLRVCELPLVFFTVLGLVSALGHSERNEEWWDHSLRRPRRSIAAVLALLLGPAVLIANQQDFFAARQSFRTDEYVVKGDYESAIRSATRAVDRLYPQRVLMNLHRLAQAHLYAADVLQARADDRERRAKEGEPPNPRLQYLAAEDYRAADEECRLAGRALKELVSAAPGFINHGQLEHRINILHARAAASRGEGDAAQAYARNAATAIEREMLRQPFEPAIALEFLRLVGTMIEPERVVDILARTLRYHRITDEYVELLRDLLQGDAFAGAFVRVVEDASNAAATDPGVPAADPWAAEKLRLGATTDFVRGDYVAAVRRLEEAALRYDRLGANPPFGAAACYGELADSRFYGDPLHPDPAIDDATRAIELAPDSRPGRELVNSQRQRLIHYYLAGGREADARRTLAELAPASVPPNILDAELASRYRRLCESLLQRREGPNLRKPADELRGKLHQWISRAIQLNPSDPAPHFIAADLALYGGDDATAAAYLDEALSQGLDPAYAMRFLEAAREKRPDSEPLRTIRERLAAPQQPAGDAAASP